MRLIDQCAANCQWACRIFATNNAVVPTINDVFAMTEAQASFR
jgi:hypothetical protein